MGGMRCIAGLEPDPGVVMLGFWRLLLVVNCSNVGREA